MLLDLTIWKDKEIQYKYQIWFIQEKYANFNSSESGFQFSITTQEMNQRSTEKSLLNF
jgi:hypothetical protein